uniref:Uncharacterized protein n=1 Tax=Schistocephalus solidus TaxID=70667 RepID=A0A0X3NSK4_SCHSO
MTPRISHCFSYLLKGFNLCAHTPPTPINKGFSFPQKATEDKDRGPADDSRPIFERLKVKSITCVNRLPSPTVRLNRTLRKDTSSSSEAPSYYENFNPKDDSARDKFGRHSERQTQKPPCRTEGNRKAVENSYDKLREYLTLLQPAASSSLSWRRSYCETRKYPSFTASSSSSFSCSSTPSSSLPSRSSSPNPLVLSSDSSSSSSCQSPSSASSSAQSLDLSSDSSSSTSSNPGKVIPGCQPPSSLQPLLPPPPKPPPTSPPRPSPSIPGDPNPSPKSNPTRRWRHRFQTVFPCLCKKN